MRKEKVVKKKILVHDGSFHCDDVCAVAVLSLLFNGQIEIIRSREAAKIATADYVLDVGGKYDGLHLFDHHQESILRDNGVPFAAFGLVWRSFGEVLCGGSDRVAKIIDQELVQPCDANDNGYSFFTACDTLSPFALPDLIHIFNNTWKEKDRKADQVFADLVEFAKGVIARKIVRTIAQIDAEVKIKKIYNESNDKKILVFDDSYPARDLLFSDLLDVIFTVTPGNDDKWRVEGVRQQPNSYKLRKSLPKKWAGLRDEELQAVSGVSDAVFCHRNLFMAAAKSREGAILLAQKALGKR